MRFVSPAPNPNAHGAVMADRDQVQQWESFILGQLGTDNKVSLLSRLGLFYKLEAECGESQEGHIFLNSRKNKKLAQPMTTLCSS